MINKEQEFTKSTEISASTAEVWDALVNPQKIKVYFFGTDAKSDWKKGSELVFEGEWEGTAYVDKGTILEIIPNQILRYDYISSFSSLEDLPENRSIITFELEEKEGKTILTLSQLGFESSQAYEHSEGSWSQILEQIKERTETGNW